MTEITLQSLMSTAQKKFAASGSRAMSLSELEGYGAKILNEFNESNRQHRALLRQKRINQLTGDGGGIPIRYASANLSDVDIFDLSDELGSAYKSAAIYAQNFTDNLTASANGMIIYGDVGTGKTRLACALANQITKDGFVVTYTTAADLISSVMSAKNFANNQDEMELVRLCQIPDLMIVDEVGAKQLGSHELNILSRVIDIRYRNMRPIICISNLTPELIRLRIGDMSYSRIIGHDSQIIEVSGDDMRINNPQKKALKHTNNSISSKDGEIRMIDDEINGVSLETMEF